MLDWVICRRSGWYFLSNAWRFQASSVGVRYRWVQSTWPSVGSSTAAKCVHSFVVGHADTHEMTSSVVTATESSILVMSGASFSPRLLLLLPALTFADLLIQDPAFTRLVPASFGWPAVLASLLLLRSAFRTLLSHLSTMHFLL